MSAIWTVLTCVAVLALAVGTFIAFETGHARTAAQRQEFANGLWAVVGVVIVALWAWNIAARRRPRR
jgi:heme/copper-type cytochrome/quinol oxidase subunit 2